MAASSAWAKAQLRSGWRRLPVGWRVRLRPAVDGLIATVRGPAPAPPEPVPDPVEPPIPEPAPPAGPPERPRVISSMEELDRKLVEIDEAYAISDDEMRRVFKTFEMQFPLPLPDDPFDPQYRELQFEVYRRISGHTTYSTDNELSGFPVDPRRPFPFYTESFDTVGHHLIALGFMILTMRLPAGASILEMGAGWGNTAVTFARMGYEVTAIDVEPLFVKLVNERAELLGLPPLARCSTFLEVDTLEERYDAVLFYESFHHCSDHVALLQKLHTVLKPGGRAFFAAEPITEAFPLPWGLRLDGESLWAIRRNGWLELGFRETYFREVLARTGYTVTKHQTDATHLGVIFEATPVEPPGS